MIRNAQLHRLSRGTRKIVRRLLWRTIGLFAKKPTIDVLYQSEDKNSVVFCCHGPVYIEPESGYLITEKGHILEESLLTNFPFKQRPFGLEVPSPFHFFKSIKQPENVIELNTAVSLRHFWEWNYYHFYFDVLGRLELFRSAGVSDSVPLVIAKYADDVSFVRPLIKRGTFAHRHWVIPRKEYVKANHVLFCRSNTAYKGRISYLLDALDVDTQSAGDKRFYLKRSSNRRLSNLADIEKVLHKYGFEIIDAAEMDIKEQISTFSQVRYLIANHGAGTTNILFRGSHPLSVLELHHENCMNYDHKKICDEMGYLWDALEGKMGEGIPAHADYFIDPAALEQKIIAMLATSPAPVKHGFVF